MDRREFARVVLCAGLCACGDDTVGSDSDGGTTAGPGLDTAISGEADGSGSGSGSGSSGGTDSEGETETEASPLCDAIDVSLVIDPDVARMDAYAYIGLRDYLDGIVASTGARVRVLPNVGTEGVYDSECFALAGNAPGDPVLLWGEDGQPTGAAETALECFFAEIQDYSSPLDDGDGMFAGVMFPVLLLEGWPAPGAVVTPMMLARTDNQNYGLGAMYNRPGLASEAYIRLAGGGERRNTAAFSMTLGVNSDGDLMETFGVSLSPFSRHYRRTEITFPGALDEYVDIATAACDAHDEVEVPELDYACKRVDILFVIDGSGSMSDEQAALQGLDGNPPVLAEFTDALVDSLSDIEDFHVGVVSTQPDATALHTYAGQPFDFPSDDNDCGLAQRWIVGPSDTLEQDFACLAATRTEMVEVPVRNAVEALASDVNEGFLRDDSLLIIVMVSDEDEQTVNYDNMELRDGLLAAVGGDLDRLLLLAIAGGPGIYEMPMSVCQGPYGHASPGRRLTTVARSLRDRGFTQDICAGDMSSTFEQLLASVISICTPEP